MSNRHGTGAIFLRNFSAYPQDRLCNAFIGSAEDCSVRQAVDLNAARWPSRIREQLAVLPGRAWNRTHRNRWRPLPVSRDSIARALAAIPFPPDLIYAICWGAEGLATLGAVVAAFPGVPLLLHIHDFWPSSTDRFPSLLRALAPRLSATWAVSSAIARFVEKATARPCSVEPQFHIELPAIYKKEHRPAGPDFRTALVGNVWQNALFADVKNAWRSCQRRLPGLGPVEWYCPPEVVTRVRAAGITPEPEIVPRGFLRSDALWQMLVSVDLALLPFSRGNEPATDYERYSLPSRITELAAAGVPMFGLTGPATPLAEYMSDKQLGPFEPAADEEKIAAALCALIVDRSRREELGRRARSLAETEFPLRPFQQSLYLRLAALASPAAP